MQQRSIRIRDLVLYERHDEGIVVSEAGKPSKAWLKAQTDVRVRECADSKWWMVIPLSGGEIGLPEPLGQVLREASIDDLRAAVACATPAGVTKLLKVFPEIQTAPFILGRALLAKSPTHFWRHRLERGDQSRTVTQVRSAETVIVAFVERVISAPDPNATRLALREAVQGLNELGIKLDAEQRERLSAFLGEIAQAGGLELAPTEDAIREWRTW